MTNAKMIAIAAFTSALAVTTNATAEPLVLNCSRLVRTDSKLGPDGISLVPTMSIATSSDDAITLVDRITVDLPPGDQKVTVKEAGSTDQVDYSGPITDSYVFGRQFGKLEGGFTTEAIINIDRSSGAYSISKFVKDSEGIKVILMTQFVGTCVKGDKQF